MDETDARVRQVFARYGLALYQSQNVERGLAILLSVVYGRPQSPEALDDLIEARFKETFGQLAKRLAENGAAPHRPFH